MLSRSLLCLNLTYHLTIQAIFSHLIGYILQTQDYSKLCSGGVYCGIVYFMAKGNHSAITEFILLGLTDNPELQALLFCVFLLMYLVTTVNNLGLIVLIQISPQLHTPMYFFLCHLAFVDFYGTSAITPNTLVNSLRKIKSMPFYACATQVCCFITFSVWELLMLSVMAYIGMWPSATLYSMSFSCLGDSAFKWSPALTFMDSPWDSYKQWQRSRCLSATLM